MVSSWKLFDRSIITKEKFRSGGRHLLIRDRGGRPLYVLGAVAHPCGTRRAVACPFAPPPSEKQEASSCAGLYVDIAKT